MQTITIFNGSPRRNGNTSFLVNTLNNGLDKSKYYPINIFLYDYTIEPCTDCRACKKGKLVCNVKDDMQELYKQIETSQIIVVATPIYWFGPTAKMKLLLDRLRPYYGNQRLKGKKSILILPAGVGEKDCDLTIEMFGRAFNSLGIDLIGSVTSKAYDIGESAKDENALNSMTNILSRINAMA